MKGLMSFVLVIAFILVYSGLIYSFSLFDSEKNFAETQLIETENASFKRNLVEQAVDSAIKEAMQKEIMFGSDDPEKIKEKTALQLESFFSEMKKKGIEFTETNSGKKAGKEFIKENSRILVLNIEGKIYVAEFIFTGGTTKNNLVSAEIKENNSSNTFMIPADYSIKIISVRLINAGT